MSAGMLSLAVPALFVTTSFAPSQQPASRSGAHREALLTPPPEEAGTAARLTVFGLRGGGPGDEDATVPALKRYRVETGDSLEGLAKRLQLSPKTLAWANPGLEGGLKPGSLLVVPAVDGVVHVVVAGETAESLAQNYQVAVSDLMEFNGLRTSGLLQVGRRLLIPAAKPPAQVPLVGGGAYGYRASEYNNFPPGWCTWYAADRREIPFKGDAGSWLAAAEALGWQTGPTPRLGAIMVSHESWLGHVAYVERVNPDGSFVVSEMNYSGFGQVNFRTIAPGKPAVIGFIY
jgi:LysM repeat protein